MSVDEAAVILQPVLNAFQQLYDAVKAYDAFNADYAIDVIDDVLASPEFCNLEIGNHE